MTAPNKTDSGTRRNLVAGFMLVLAMMAVISLTSLYYLHRHNESMEHIVSVHYEKTRLLQQMQDAMRMRQISIRDMLIETDDFARDEAWLSHNRAAAVFLAARDMFEQQELTTAETHAYERLREAVTTGGYAQQNLVTAILDNQPSDSLWPVIAQAVRTQRVAFEQLQILQGIQQEAAQQALEAARDRYKFITFITLTIGGACLIAGGLIAILVIRQFKRNLRLLNEHQEQLEHKVAQRTTDLRTAVSELEALSYSLAHDLRTPLRAVTGFSQILLEESGHNFSDEERGQLQRIASAGKFMAQLIDDIRTLGRLSRCSLDRQDMDLSTLADNILYELRATDTQREIDVQIEEGLLAHADPALMRLVFHNLFDNSLKFASPERKLSVYFRRSGQDPATFVLGDNGCGFEKVYAEKVFKPFERLHKSGEHEGTGIGLAIVERVIHRHGGKIWAEPEADTGTRICFSLQPDTELGHFTG